MEYEQITYEVSENIATITMNRPDQLNAFTGRMMVEMIDAFDQTDADDAKIGFVFAKRGLVPEAASSWFLTRAVGISRAMEWVATGRVFLAQEALDAGLVRSIHPKDEVLGVARAIGREIAENTAPVSVALSRQMLWRMLGADHPMEAHKIDSRAIDTRGASEDVREGVTSFLEKRPASYPMKVSSGMPDWFPWWPEREFE